MTRVDDSFRVSNPFIYHTGWLDRLLCHSQFYVRLRRRYWWWQLGEIGPEGLLTGPGGMRLGESSFQQTYSPWGPKQYELNLHLLAQTSRQIGATPVFLTQARLVTATNGEQERKKIGYEYAKLSHGALVRALSDCDAALYRVAAAEGVPLLDLSKLLSGRDELFVDHVHTTPTGSQAIAAAVADFLADVIRKGPA